jgi:hypothetical protein
MALLAIATLMLGCATVRPVPIETTTNIQTVVRDSLVIHRDTVTISIPDESSAAYQVQSSHLESTVAYSDASVDSTGLLSHTLVNKPVKFEREIVYLDKIRTEYRDSIVTKEVPVEVEVVQKVIPKWAWMLLVFNLLALIISLLACMLKKKVIPL